MEARAGNSLTKRDFQITNETDGVEMGFLDYKRESRFTIHPFVLQFTFQNPLCTIYNKKTLIMEVKVKNVDIINNNLYNK